MKGDWLSGPEEEHCPLPRFLAFLAPVLRFLSLSSSLPLLSSLFSYTFVLLFKKLFKFYIGVGFPGGSVVKNLHAKQKM